MLCDEIAPRARRMILRRLAHAIREQNWFAVVLEVTVVVLGIFVGLQVNDWNQRRLERESDQRAALALFVDELQLMLEEARVDVDFVTASLQDLSFGFGNRAELRCE